MRNIKGVERGLSLDDYLASQVKVDSITGCHVPRTASGRISVVYREIAKEMHLHRLAYRLYYGDSPKFIVSECSTPQCCNPKHLKGSNVKPSTYISRKSWTKMIGTIKLNSRDFWAMDRAGIIKWDLHPTSPVVVKDGLHYKIKIVPGIMND